MINGAFDEARFVNRQSEIDFIREKCLPSLRENRPINPQFIQLNGVWGIGKTTMLRKIQHSCSKENLQPIWIEANDSPEQVFHKIDEQVRDHYQIVVTPPSVDALDRSLHVMRALLKKYGMAVVFIDSLDASDEEHFKHVKDMLDRLTEDSKLLFVMASRKMIDFQKTASIGRKLKLFSLKPFSRAYCVIYIKKLTPDLKEEEIDQIFLLTNGYPVAVDVSVETVKQEKLDLMAEEGRKRLMHVINEQVIEQGILAKVRHDPDQLLWHQTMLNLFSTSRRFNLTLMQKMIEKFAEQYRLGSSLAYMSFLQRINFNTGLLDWNETRTGYAMESPVRHLFLTKLKIENPESFSQIHEFLMDENWRFAMQLSGTDKLHSIQEYLYHSASCLDDEKLKSNVDKAMKEVLSETTELLLQFEEEYKKDNELQDALGVHKNSVLAMIYQFFAKSHEELVSTSLDKQERIDHWRSAVLYSIKDPTVADPDRLPLVRQILQRVKAQETVDVYSSLIKVLLEDEEIKEVLGKDSQKWNLE